MANGKAAGVYMKEQTDRLMNVNDRSRVVGTYVVLESAWPWNDVAAASR